MPTARAAASRRTALAAVGVVAGITTLSCARDEGDVDRVRGRASDGAGTRPGSTGDDALLVEARGDLAAAEQLVAATRRRHRPLRARLVPLLRTHRDQLAVLDPEGLAAPPPSRTGDGAVGAVGDPAAALARLLREEERL
jgi:hypothetical protein